GMAPRRRLVARVVHRGVSALGLAQVRRRGLRDRVVDLALNLSLVLELVSHLCLQYQRQALADADADSSQSITTAPALELVSELAEDAHSGSPERMSQRDRATIGIHLVGVQILPLRHVRETLRRKCLV